MHGYSSIEQCEVVNCSTQRDFCLSSVVNTYVARLDRVATD